ncbi:prepilin peptidase [Sphingomonas sp. MG17]|uniref:Prepilin peptidase n=1 Tax=Sphingomonas tagetis TaxID=2949092 RepID=A0A9X2HPB5_9SPHN|nr:prepilin peptidase [Sphingomonas tagetis]MCP3729525.1 prepilin peptidase [Sphingomonas tagetis]
MIATGLLAILILLLLAAALQDIYQLRIANFFAVAIVLLFPVYAAVKGPDWSLWQNLVVFAGVFALGMAAFAARWLGGGDVKLLAATALWFDIAGAGWLIGAVALAGGIVALLFMLLRRIIPESLLFRTHMVALKPRGPVPYGIGIAAGAISAIALGHVSP